MGEIYTEVLTAVPSEARALIWKEFFQSRGRGVSLSVHSPWIDAPDGLFCVTATEASDGAMLGTLVVKLHASGDGQWVGMIGYVCVVPVERGRGISRSMLDRAAVVARERGLEALILWSQTPQVYRCSGFELCDNDVFRQYAAIKPERKIDEPCIENWPGNEPSLRGLPAFASGARRISGERTSIVVLDTPSGPSIAEWVGADADVVDLIGTSLDGNWWLNAFATDGLLAELDARTVAVLQERPSGMMLCSLGCGNSASGVRLLDRI